MSVLNGKTHKLQMRKYDVSMTSLIAKNTKLFHYWNLNIFQGDIKENVSRCFLSQHSVV